MGKMKLFLKKCKAIVLVFSPKCLKFIFDATYQVKDQIGKITYFLTKCKAIVLVFSPKFVRFNFDSVHQVKD